MRNLHFIICCLVLNILPMFNVLPRAYLLFVKGNSKEKYETMSYNGTLWQKGAASYQRSLLFFPPGWNYYSSTERKGFVSLPIKTSPILIGREELLASYPYPDLQNHAIFYPGKQGNICIFPILQMDNYSISKLNTTHWLEPSSAASGSTLKFMNPS